MKKTIFGLLGLSMIMTVPAFGQSLEQRVRSLEMRVRMLEDGQAGGPNQYFCTCSLFTANKYFLYLNSLDNSSPNRIIGEYRTLDICEEKLRLLPVCN